MLNRFISKHFEAVQFASTRKWLNRFPCKQIVVCKAVYGIWRCAEGSVTKEISYTSWRNQLKSSWNHEKLKQISLKSSSEISPTLQPHPLLQHMTSFMREITGKSNRNQEISYAKMLVADPSRCALIGIPTWERWRRSRGSMTNIVHTGACM